MGPLWLYKATKKARWSLNGPTKEELDVLSIKLCAKNMAD